MPSDKIKPPSAFPQAYARALRSMLAKYDCAPEGKEVLYTAFHECAGQDEARMHMRKARAFLRSLPRYPESPLSQEAARIAEGKVVRCKLLKPDQRNPKFRAVFRVTYAGGIGVPPEGLAGED